jgi:acyl-CoA synthetase (AMP-forming)/AMP-acid ligase II
LNTFSELLQSAYQNMPESVVITLQKAGDEDNSISYKNLIEGAAGYAKTYAKQGIQPGEVVILILQHGIDLVYAFWGAVLHGAIPSIMPYLTEKLLPERYRHDLEALISVTRPVAIVTYPEFEVEVRPALKEGDSVRTLILSDSVEQPCQPDFNQLGGIQRDPDDIVLLQHSSGTTGLQKGVALSHQAVFNQLANLCAALDYTKEDVIVSWLPLYHDMGLIAGFILPILTGHHLVLLSPFDWVKAPQRLFHAITKYNGSLVWLPNFAYYFCAQKIRDRHLEGVDLSSLRAVINCSEPVRDDGHQVFLEKFKPYGLDENALAVSYAMAENVFGVTQTKIGQPLYFEDIDREVLQTQKFALPADPGKATVRMVSCGKPIPNVEIKIVDQNGNTLKDRRVGEVAVHSNCMLTEYYNRPDATEETLLPDDYFLTGDFGYKVGEQLFITGRKKDLIIVGGKNVYPMDIEQLAMEVDGVHPGRVSVFGVYDESKGTEDVVLVAEVDTQEEEERQRITNEIRAVVNRGSAISLRQIYLVDPGWMVKTSSGKNSRYANRDRYLKETS